LEEENAPEIVLNESVLEQSNVCDTSVGEDPWGGCPVAAGDIYSVRYYDEETSFYFNPQDLASGSYPGHSVKFKGDNCVVEDNRCATFSLVGTLSDENGILLLTNQDALNQTTQDCSGNNWYYVYDNSDCS
jgi:hypothetical protein